ncbi:MAG: hypothetical protein ACE5GK_12740 [Nitrospiria bacterium]
MDDANLGKAEVEYKKGERLGKLRKRIAEARTALKQAVEAAGVTKVALAKVLEARRQIAVHEFIRKLATNKFNEAERHFLAAIQKAEKGDIRGARGKGENTLKKYREATLQAVEKGPLQEVSAQVKKSKETLSRKQYSDAMRELESRWKK